MSNAVTFMVKLVIRFAPICIFGLVSSTRATTGFSTLWGYAQLLVVLVGCMLPVSYTHLRQWRAAGEIVDQWQDLFMGEFVRNETVEGGLKCGGSDQMRLVAVAPGMQNL